MKIPKPATTAIICGIAVVVLLGGYAAIRGAMNASMSSAGNPTTVTVYQTPAITKTPDVTPPTTTPPIDLNIQMWGNPNGAVPGPQDLPVDQAAQVIAHAAQDIFGVDPQGANLLMQYATSIAIDYIGYGSGSATTNPGDSPGVGGVAQSAAFGTWTTSATWSGTLATADNQKITVTINAVTGQLYAMADAFPLMKWTCDDKQNASASPESQQAATDLVTTKLAPDSPVVAVTTQCTAKSDGSEKVLVTLTDDSVYLVSVNAKHQVYAFQYFSSASLVDYGK